MTFRRFEELAAPEMPARYGLRAFRAGDEDAWVDLLSTGDFGVWNRDRLDRMLAGERAVVPREGIYFATQGDGLVGTACAVIHRDEASAVAELGWVVADPSHRRRGLGTQVCRAVMAYLRDAGHRYVFLLTDDFRLPAIRAYLGMGFEPEMTDPSHPSRWQAITERLEAVTG
jgi:mycothiol synthase